MQNTLFIHRQLISVRFDDNLYLCDSKRLSDMGKWHLVIFLILFTFVLSNAQKEVTTLSGQRIIIQSSGSWENAYSIIPSSDTIVLPDQVSAKSNAMSETETGFVTMILEAAQKKEIETFLSLDQLDKELSINHIAINQAKVNKDKEKGRLLKKEMKILKERIYDSNKIYKTVALDIAEIKSIRNLKPKERSAKIKTYNALYLGSQTYGKQLSNTTPILVESKPKTKAAATLKSATIVDCNFAIDTKINKQRHLATEPSYIFEFTPDRLKSYFKDKELMRVDVHLEKIGKQQYLGLTVKIISKDAAKNYGMIQKESMLKITFINGNNVILKAIDDARPSIEPYTGNSIYNIKYLMEGDDVRLFSKLPLDTLGIMWSSGFELYDIYNVDVLINQLKCLNSYEN